jgi:hypothetical protein
MTEVVTTESRIAANASAYFDARSNYNHFLWRVLNEKRRMDQAVKNLMDLGADLEKLGIKP